MLPIEEDLTKNLHIITFLC